MAISPYDESGRNADLDSFITTLASYEPSAASNPVTFYSTRTNGNLVRSAIARITKEILPRLNALDRFGPQG